MNAPVAKYKVLLASPWENPNNGTSGVTWTVAGRAFVSRDGTGMNVFIHNNLSVSGMLVIKLDDGSDDSYRGSPADERSAVDNQKSRKRPSVPPPGDPLDDIPF
jgi:hypothetical protein